MLGLIIFLPDSGYDKYFWVEWAKYLRQHGLFEAYNNPEINYHPVLIYFIDAFSFLHWRTIDYTSINWLKVPTAVFDWGIIFIGLKLMQKHKINLQWGLLLAFNPAFWYNTVIWGQFDSIWVFFTLLAFYLADKGKFSLSAVAFIMALNTKLFAVIFLPFLVVIWLKKNHQKTKYTLTSIAIAIGLQVLLLMPFLYATQYTLYAIIQRSTEYYNSVSRNAYNVWYYFFDNPVTTADTNLLVPAIIGFIIIYLILLYFIFIKPSPLRGRVWEGAALISLIFFLFLTRMHERYAHAALVFSFIAFLNSPFIKGVDSRLGGKTGDLARGILPFLLISHAYILNLEAVMQTLNKSLGYSINYNSILFNPKLIATLYVISLILLLYNTLNTRKLPSP